MPAGRSWSGPASRHGSPARKAAGGKAPETDEPDSASKTVEKIVEGMQTMGVIVALVLGMVVVGAPIGAEATGSRPKSPRRDLSALPRISIGSRTPSAVTTSS